MPARLVECVPNFSEGRRPEVIEAVVAGARGVDGVTVLNVQSDVSHNRTVLTFAGDLDPVARAVLALTRQAVAHIDMTHHTGEHPRLGAVDVVPFVPIGSTTMDECVELARRVGGLLWADLGVPVYFYAEAAATPQRVKLPDIRKGEFEGLAEKMRHPDWQPDVGDPRPHPTAGATVVGARRPLIAYNINLQTTDVGVAKAVARAVRESSGGLMSVQAMGVAAATGLAQVSINVLDHARTPLARIFDLVRVEAERYGVAIAESEVVGLIPLDALLDAARASLRMRGFSREQVLEVKLME
jgi:glutamate formiminotransferase